MIEIDHSWLYVQSPMLHAATGLGRVADGSAFSWLIMDCGTPVEWAILPPAWAAVVLPRCENCCVATGLPSGKGSPRLDPACREALGLPPRVVSREVLD